ncbi:MULTISPECIES: hypothetical protein [Halomonas]|uniref:hypothetical protein n=1 Tax=Halomonas TaxID=2745 RepID=UPI0018693328|nr:MULTISPECIES: hypothetical protein [Halomonas]
MPAQILDFPTSAVSRHNSNIRSPEYELSAKVIASLEALTLPQHHNLRAALNDYWERKQQGVDVAIYSDGYSLLVAPRQ